MTGSRTRVERLAAALAAAPVLAWSAWVVGLGDVLPRVPATPPTPALGPVDPWGTALTLVLVPAAYLAVPREGPGAVGLLSMAAGVLVAASYPWVNLDWSLLLLDLGLARGGVPPAPVVAAALAPLGLAWAVHAVLLSRRARDHYAGKELPDGEAEAAARAVRRWTLPPALAGLAGTALAWLGFRVEPLEASVGPVVAPLVLVAAVAGAAVLGLRRVRGVTGG